MTTADEAKWLTCFASQAAYDLFCTTRRKEKAANGESVNPDLKEVADHIRGLAQGALAHANWHANYASHENPYWNELSVIQAAHAMELFIKARIAQEHPLLIFSKTPRESGDPSGLLSIRDLVERGQTLTYSELPDRLWASTGIRLGNAEKYFEFGKLRNCIQHFSVPVGVDCGEATIGYIYDVIDPFINNCWGYFAIDYNEDHEPYQYLVEGLINRGVEFLVSEEAKRFIIENSEWPNDKYKGLMINRATTI